MAVWKQSVEPETMNWNNIPDELKKINRWCAVDDSEEIGKKRRPICPYTYAKDETIKLLRVTDKLFSFKEVVDKTITENIGIFIPEGYIVIDSDALDRFRISSDEKKIWAKDIINYLKTCQTYTEFSASGKAFHSWYKLPSGMKFKGFKYRNFQIMVAGQFVATTGNILEYMDKRFTFPIQEDEELIKHYLSLAGKDEIDSNLLATSPTANLEDQELLNKLFSAENGQKAKDLYSGNWQEYYPNEEGTGSSADMGLIAMFLSYTRDKGQIKRLFLSSTLAQRASVKRKGNAYITRTVERALFVKEREEKQALQQVDFEELAKLKPVQGSAVPKLEIVESRNKVDGILVPREVCPILHDTCNYLYEASTIPIHETSFLAALTFFAGTLGRSYDVVGNGLNLYILFLARTGMGKEEIKNGVDDLWTTCREAIPALDQYYGASDYASGQALLKALSEHPCKLAVFNEFKEIIRKMKDTRNPANAKLKTVMLDVFSKSDKNKKYNGTAYADIAKNVGIIDSPCFTFIGDSVPAEIYESLDSSLIFDGLLGRMLIFEYNGTRPTMNYNKREQMPLNLKEKIVEVLKIAHDANISRKVIQVQGVNELEEFGQYCNDKFNHSENSEIESSVWGRAHAYSLKIAALLAVLNGHIQPVIGRDQANFAVDLVSRAFRNLLDKFDQGEIGSAFGTGRSHYLRIMQEWINAKPEFRKKYQNCSQALMETDNPVVPIGYLRRRLSQVAYFSKHPRGHKFASDEMQRILQDEEVIGILDPEIAKNRYNTNVRSTLLVLLKGAK